jgi:hypothetical protein
MAEQPPSFEDDGLKAAVQRAWGKEPAPADLQRRVAALVAAGRQVPREPETRPREKPSRMRLRPRWYPIAASILCILGVGWLSYTLYDQYRPRGPTIVIGPRGKPKFELPESYLKGMVARHDEAVAGAATAPSQVQLASLDTLKAELTKQINNPVAVISPGDAWTLKSARATSIADNKTAQFLFAKNDSPNTTVSLFSVPVFRPYTPVDGAEYDQSFNGHAVAGFVSKEMIYCIVLNSPDGSVKIEQLEPLRTQLEGMCN